MNSRFSLLLALGLSACSTPDVVKVETTEVPSRAAPPGAAPGTCWHEDITPAQFSETREKFLVREASISTDGKTRFPAKYRIEVTRTQTAPESRLWVEVPCDGTLLYGHVAALQRALKARGFYDGPITERLDAQTRHAIRRFQLTFAIDSETLSLETAKRLGLVRL
ncbi:MAG: peptidoglycan-binding domain-containing protein [Pseudomonadota bacterium]